MRNLRPLKETVETIKRSGICLNAEGAAAYNAAEAAIKANYNGLPWDAHMALQAAYYRACECLGIPEDPEPTPEEVAYDAACDEFDKKRKLRLERGY